LESTLTRISVVSYLNALPFLQGLADEKASENFIITKDIPSICAQKLINHETDIGLIPIAMIEALNYSDIITDYCIAADGAVGSVLLVSNEPIEELTTIYKDSESRTSVLLANILANYFWKQSFVWKEEQHNFLEPPAGSGIVIIGDRALKNRSNFKYVYDLAEEWKKFTSLPFVFACWVSNKKISETEIQLLNDCFKDGVNSRAEIASMLESGSIEIDTLSYFTNYIKYELTTEAKQGMELFLKYVNQLKSS
jgi:chorismate dehydratase